jgi:hypothetical protein
MTLTSAIGIALAGVGMQAVADATRPYQLTDVAADAANVDGTYIITFAEAGLYNYEGGVAGLARTAPNKAAGERKLDRTSMAAHSYEAYLEAQRVVHRTAIENAIKRPLDVTHSYGITFNGVAASLSPEEAAEVARLPGIESVRPAGVYHLDTYRGPAFIGADKIWDGSGTPSGVGTKGQGVKVGVIDGGANSAHPSFANDPACGFSAGVPKLIARDCSTSAGGICNGPDPQANPTYGHGVHTASTVAGNTIDNTVSPPPSLPDGTTMSGVAPCAQVFQYKVCPTNSCGGAAIAAGIQNAIADGVDAINFSISGGTSPWSSSESDRMFLDAVDAGVFVAASAGNTSTTITNPVGQVNHRGPWVMTVAASTHDEKIGPTLWAAGPGTPPPATQKIALNPGSTTDSGATTDLTGMPIADYPANLIGCTANGGFPANHFQGKIAVVRRGTCPFTEKITNAYAAGASMVLIANNQVGSINMDTTGAPAVPAFSLDQVSGDALIAFIDANPPGTVDPDVIFKDGFDGAAAPTGATANYRRVAAASRQGDVLADFSFRGPTPAPLADLTKPDITAPGVDIYAATDPASGQYEFLSGTSMSGPHVAGSGALMKAVHPDWTPMEIRSALMMTAKSDGFQENGTTPWNIDDVGSGRVRVDQAARAGLTMNETKANFLAADPSGGSIDVKQLNIPSLRNMACNGTCTWTRKVKNRLATSGNWTVTTVTDPAFSVTVSPSTFNLAPGAEQTLTFTASPSANITAPKFGYVTLKENGGLSPDQRITVAVKGTAGGLPIIAVAPTSLSSTQATNTTQTKTLTVSNTGGGSLSWSVSATGTGSIWNQPQNGTSGIVSSYSSADNGGGFTAADFQVSATSNIKKIKVFGFDNTSSLANQPKITWRIYGDASGSPAGNPDTNTGTPVWTFDSAPNGAGVSLADTGVITLDLVAAGQNLNLPAGTYWLTVYPTYANAIGPAGSARWNWFQAAQQAGPAKLVGTMFGVPNWSPLGVAPITTAYTDVAFTIDGDITCGASWLSLSPTSGNVSGGGNATVTATFNSNGLANGTYNASACIASNDASNPVVTVPVTLTVQSGGSNPVAAVTPASISLTAAQNASANAPLNIANIGGGSLTYTITEAAAAARPSSYLTSAQAFAKTGSIASGTLARNPQAGDGAAGRSFVLDATQISQMADNTPGNEGVSCGSQTAGTTADNSWWRRFYFSEHAQVGASASITGVTVSSGSNVVAGGLPVTINLYTIPHSVAVNTIPTSQLTLIGTKTATITDGLASITVPVTGTVTDTVGKDLVVEFHTDGNTSGGQWFPGANATTETHPTFISSTACGISAPTTTSGIGFPNFHLTMVVNVDDGGTPPPVCQNPSDIPWLSASPTSGSVAGGNNTNVTVTGNANGLAVGTYTANICVATNDPAHAMVAVPVTMTVQSGGGNQDLVCAAPNHALAETFDGSSINWITGVIDDVGNQIHWNPYNAASSGPATLAFYWPTAGGGGGASVGGVYSVLQVGNTVGPANTFIADTGANTGAVSNWRAGADGYLGFKLGCTGGTCYGFAHLRTTAANGFPATLVNYCYNKVAGSPITIQ